MTVSEIENLLPVWEDSSGSGLGSVHWLDQPHDSLARFREREKLKSLPDFGWETAKRITAGGSGKAPPGAPYWVQHAVKFLKGRQSGDTGRAIGAALTLRNDPQCVRLLEAALIAPDATTAGIAKAFQVPALVINAYDSLFFNILDRREDPMYAERLMRRRYPKSSLNIPDIPDVGRRLMEIGFSGSLEDVLVAGGIRSGGLARLAEISVKEMLRVVAGVSDGSVQRRKTDGKLIEVVMDRKAREEQQRDEEANRGSSIGAMLSAQLEEDRRTLGLDIERQAAAGTDPGTSPHEGSS